MQHEITCKFHWPFFLATVIYLLSMFFLYQWILHATDGHFIYGLDDPYVHMAIAKNFALHGIWGITPYEFTSSSSSVLWPLLLAGWYYLFGVNDYVPLILNLIFAILSIYVAYKLLKSHLSSSRCLLTVLLLFVFVAPLTMPAYFGMEHLLHLYLTLAYVSLVTKLLADDDQDPKQPLFLWTCFFTILIVLVRYEAFALVVVVSLLLLFKKQFRRALTIILLAGMPMSIFGLVSMYYGGWFIPTTSIKTQNPLINFLHILDATGADLINLLFFLVIGLCLYIGRSKKDSPWAKVQLLLTIAIGCVLLQLPNFPIGWYFRYQVYLLGLCLVVYGIVLQNWFAGLSKKSRRDTRCAQMILIVVMMYPMAQRAGTSFKNTSVASKNIYDQQYQMSRFVSQFYPTGFVACNDIGAISYFNDQVHTVDLYGLASSAFAKEKLKQRETQKTNPEFYAQMVKDSNVDVIMIYDSWFKGNIPSSWIKVGEWEVSKNFSGEPTVSFYAPDASKRSLIIEQLNAFSPHLPSDVLQRGLYRKS